MNFKKKLVGILTIIFSSSFILTQISAIKVHASETQLLDYSSESSLDTITLNGVDLLENITSKTLIQSEKNYLAQYNYDFNYEGKIATTYVDSKIENNQLFVYINEYSYLDKNNRMVTWTPQYVTFENEEFNVSYNSNEKNYQCIIPYLDNDTSSIDVTYKCDFSLNKDIVNEMANLAYNQADEYVKQDIIGKANAKYESELNLYNQQVLDYQNYLNALNLYQQENEKYQLYLNQKEQYDLEYKAYEQYLNQYNQYLLDKEEYEQYLIAKEKFLKDNLVYENYVRDQEKYESDYQNYLNEYQIYLSTMENIQYRLDLMELIKTPMTSLNRSVYNAVMGDAVTQILGKKDELEVLNVDPKLVETAEKATRQLRIYFKDYFETCKNDEEKYTYYKTNYGTNYEKGGAIKYYLVSLFTSLEKLYRSGLVPQGLDYMNKRKEYVILLAQLAYISDAISQDAIYTYEGKKNGEEIIIYGSNPWKIDGRSVLEILENDLDFQIDKALARPKENYPTMPTKPTPPVVVEKPVEPTCSIQSEPIEPKAVKQPSEEPKVVEKPVLPEKVDMPQNMPIKPVFDEKIVALVEDYNNGLLLKREELKEDYILSLTSSFSKNILNTDLIHIDFYGEDNRLLGTSYTDKGSFIVYNGEKVSKSEDQIYKVYVFDYWQYEDGEKLDLNNVTKSGSVYPVFKGVTYQTYTITWNIDGLSINEQFQYGEMPSYSGECIKEATVDYEYKFKSWNKPLEKVTKDETYIAQFDEIKRYYITWIIDDQSITEIYYFGETPKYNDNIDKAHDGQYYYTFTAWDKKIENVTENVEYTAIFSKKPIVQINNQKIDILYNESIREISLNINHYNQIDLQKLFELVLNQNEYKSLKINTDDAVVYFQDIVIAQLINKNVGKFILNIQNKNLYEYYINLDLQDKDGNQIDLNQIDLLLNGQFDASHSSLYEILKDDSEAPIRFETFTNQQINAIIENGVVYHIYPMYSIVCDNNEMVLIQTDKTKARIGEVITIQTQLLKPGLELDQIIVLDAKGNKVECINNEVVMGTSDLNILARYKEIVYNVQFYVDGELYSSKEYKYGDEIVLPPTPIKADEYDWKYTFEGWDKTIESTVKENAVYTAVFSRTEIIHPVEPKKIRLVVIIRIVLISFVTLIICGITLIVLKKKGFIFKKKH